MFYNMAKSAISNHDDLERTVMLLLLYTRSHGIISDACYSILVAETDFATSYFRLLE